MVVAETARHLHLKVLARRRMGQDFATLTLAAPPDFQSLPGQFLNIQAGPEWDQMTKHADRPAGQEHGWPRLKGAELAKPVPFVRRPISIARLSQAEAGEKRIEIIIRISGKGTRFLAEREPGDALDAIGPLGNHFTIHPRYQRAILVAGGCGIAPLLGLAEQLKGAKKDVSCVLGCRSAANMPVNLRETIPPHGKKVQTTAAVDEFSRLGIDTILSTDDGSAGYDGPATEAFEKYLETVPTDDLAVYCCGPRPMMKAVAALTTAQGIFCEVSLEEYMGCGIGVCLSCACKVQDKTNKDGWTYRMTCTDGPVLRADEIIWE